MEPLTPAQEAALTALAAEQAAHNTLTKRYTFFTNVLIALVLIGLFGGGLGLALGPRPVSKGLIIFLMLVGTLQQIGMTWIGIWYKHSYTKNSDLKKMVREEMSSHCFSISLLLVPLTFFWGWMWIGFALFFALGFILSTIRRRAILRELEADRTAFEKKITQTTS